MKKITGFIVGATLFCALSTAQADVIAPDALIKNTVQDVVTIIKQDKEIQSGNERKIAALVDAKVVPHFDFVRMTQLAIGKNWRSATPAQKEALVTGFRNMLVRTYTKSIHGIS
jgi:phospholipid transport system substrate-binding protein